MTKLFDFFCAGRRLGSWVRCFLNGVHRLCRERPIVAWKRHGWGEFYSSSELEFLIKQRRLLVLVNRGDRVQGRDVVEQEQSPGRMAGLWPARAPSLPGQVVFSWLISDLVQRKSSLDKGRAADGLTRLTAGRGAHAPLHRPVPCPLAVKTPQHSNVSMLPSWFFWVFSFLLLEESV